MFNSDQRASNFITSILNVKYSNACIEHQKLALQNTERIFQGSMTVLRWFVEAAKEITIPSAGIAALLFYYKHFHARSVARDDNDLFSIAKQYYIALCVLVAFTLMIMILAENLAIHIGVKCPTNAI